MKNSRLFEIFFKNSELFGDFDVCISEHPKGEEK